MTSQSRRQRSPIVRSSSGLLLRSDVLGQVTFDETKLTVPFMWTKSWGKGKVFFAAWGHTYKEFDVPEAKEIVLRGMLWASK